MPANNELALWGTPRKRALFGSDGQNSISSGNDVPEGEYSEVAQSSRSPQNDDRAGTRLVDAVLQLQKDMEEFPAESGYGSARRQATPVQTSGRSGFTSTPVPMHAGMSSWDQYRHVFEAIVCLNGWDGVTAALQLVAHLEGDALNVALLVPQTQRVLPGVLVRALSEHDGSPGRLAEYRRQFERAFRSPGDDPSVFAIELETLARRAYGDVDDLVWLQFVKDKFIEGQAECSLHRHLDSVGPDIPMEDIVDRCRVWESHAEDMSKWEVGHKTDQPRAVYQVASVDATSRPNDASADKDVLGELMSHLLPTPEIAPLRVTPIQSDYELLVQRLLGTVQPVQPRLQDCSSVTDMDVLLQSLLLVASVGEETVCPPADHREPDPRCFSCGEMDHTTPRCPDLDESFPFLPVGWRADREDDEFVLQPPQKGATGPPAGNVD